MTSLLFPQITLAEIKTEEPPDMRVVAAIQAVLDPSVVQFEDISKPLVEKGKKRQYKEAVRACKRRGGRVASGWCRLPHQPQKPVRTPQRVPTILPKAIGGLMGSIGYAIPYGNCVNQVPPGRRPGGNPISWAVTTQRPYIGAIALWHYNHVGIVTGIWSNGDIEVRHENFWGGQHRFPRSAFRGFR